MLLAFASSSFADTIIRVTGSTAFRASAMAAMRDMLSGVTYKYNSSTLNASTNALFQGTITGHAELGIVTIKATWSGSTDGINQMANGLTGTVYYADATGATGAGAASQTANITESGNAPDLIMMDTAQALTPYQANPITDEVVGAFPFVWVASKDTPAGLTNITAQQMRQMFATGYLSLSAFTGKGADSPVNTDGTTNAAGGTVFMAGRDTGSGTRTSTLSETAYGALNGVTQVGPTATVRVSTVSGSPLVTVLAADQPGISANMTGKAVAAVTGVLPATTVSSYNNATHKFTLANNATSTTASTTITIGSTAGNTAAALYITPDAGNGGQASGGSLADQLRLTTIGATDPFGLQSGSAYSTNCYLVTYLGLSDADRAVNGTGSGISVGTNVGCRFLSYEGVSIMGGVVKTYTIASQGAGATVLTTATSPITDGVIVGQLVSGTGIAPGTTVTATSSTSITLSTATVNASTLTSNAVKCQQFLPASMRGGQYSFWSYQRVGYRTLNTNKTTIKDTYVAQLTSSSNDLGAVSAVPNDNDLRVTRSDVGAPISLKY